MSDIKAKMADIAAKREQINQLYAELNHSVNMRALLKEHGFTSLEGAVRVGPCKTGLLARRHGSTPDPRSGLGRELNVLSIKCNGVEIMLNEPIPFGEWEQKYGPIRPTR
jgi:hypothetical protein